MKKICPKTLGFTLIELLVTVSIIGILFGVGIAFYNQFNQRQTVVQAAKQMKTYLRLAQSKALTGEKDKGCGSGSLKGWFIDFSAKKIYGECGSAKFGIIPLEIPENVSVTSGVNPLKFNTFVGGVEIDTETTICVFGFGKKYKLIVTRGGEIKDGGFTPTCP